MVKRTKGGFQIVNPEDRNVVCPHCQLCYDRIVHPMGVYAPRLRLPLFECPSCGGHFYEHEQLQDYRTMQERKAQEVQK